MTTIQKTNIENINSQNVSMDFVIISTNDFRQMHFWQERLTQTLPHQTKVIIVNEKWEGGAGNGLGSLYAYQQAQKQALDHYGVNLEKEQAKGAAIAIYHTAGKGMRLMPLTLSESNNKSAVKLPGMVQVSGKNEPITLLEAVIKQTSIYAKSRRGRLSVFWGDQIFIPSTFPDYVPTHPVDILARRLPFPNEETWEKLGLSQYGLLTINAENNIQLIEKTSYQILSQLIKSHKVSVEGGIGMSLGSFSLSYEMTMALLEEFKEELHHRSGKLDSDTAFWMPLVLDQETYLATMLKHANENFANRHFARMGQFKAKFDQMTGSPLQITYVDVGNESLWWDYGTVQSYYQNALKLLSSNFEGEMMRLFFNLDANYDPIAKSIFVDCSIAQNKAQNSVLVGVKGNYVDVKDSILINSSLTSFKGEGCLAYNVLNQGSDHLSQGKIRSDVSLKPEQAIKMYTTLDRDGKTDWSQQLPDNHYSYEHLHELIQKN